ncbi:MAG: hypothetical protein ACK4WH_05975 [Phycisphaerales bacterium]
MGRFGAGGLPARRSAEAARRRSTGESEVFAAAWAMVSRAAGRAISARTRASWAETCSMAARAVWMSGRSMRSAKVARSVSAAAATSARVPRAVRKWVTQCRASGESILS